MPTYQDVFVSAFEEELQKIAAAKQAALSPDMLKLLGAASVGAMTFESVRRANQDRRMGRMMRLQNQY